MSKRKRRKFTKAQKADAVRLVRVSGESIPTIAKARPPPQAEFDYEYDYDLANW